MKVSQATRLYLCVLNLQQPCFRMNLSFRWLYVKISQICPSSQLSRVDFEQFTTSIHSLRHRVLAITLQASAAARSGIRTLDHSNCTASIVVLPCLIDNESQSRARSRIYATTFPFHPSCHQSVQSVIHCLRRFSLADFSLEVEQLFTLFPRV